MYSLDTLRTARLHLHCPREADSDDLARLFADPDVGATLGGVRSQAETRGMLDRYTDHWRQHGFGLWIMRDPETGAFIGRGGLCCCVIEDRDEVEVSYALLPAYWGRGLATELACASVRVGFDVLGRPDLICFTLPTNRASQRVMQKAGFVYERDGMHFAMPHQFYRLTAERWRELTDAAGR